MRDEISFPILKDMVELVRACEPSQPLTIGVWRVGPSNPISEIERYALDESDIITYHWYGTYRTHVKLIARLKKEGRPLMNTEWLGRCLYNDVFSLFPLFYMDKIGCYNWGFVAGKYQTYEPWELTWQRYNDGIDTTPDFTKWFHDLYRPNHRPYDPKEIELIKEFCALADKDFKEAHDR